MITALQHEFKHLLYLEYTAIGVIQRDFDQETISETIKELAKNVVDCKKRIEEILQQEEVKDEEEKEIQTDFDYTGHLQDWRAYIDSL